MSRDRAAWDEHTTAVLLDLVAKQKELCHWVEKCPTSIRWNNIYADFNAQTSLGYHKKQLQNKFNDLKRAFFNWHDAVKHTGLGRDPDTGEVAADHDWYAAVHGENSQAAGDKYKRPPCCDQLFTLFGHTPRDRGALVSTGGHGTQQTSSAATPQTHHQRSNEPLLPQSVGSLGKRLSSEQYVASPSKRKAAQSHSIDDCLEDLGNIIKEKREQQSHRMTDAEEVAQVHQILKADGYSESDLFFAQTAYVCTNRVSRRFFLNFTDKEGRMNYVKFSCEMMSRKDK